MFDIDHLKVDPGKSREGAWVDYLRGSRLKIARLSNEDAEAYRLRVAIDNADLFTAGGEKAEVLAHEVETHVLAHYVLKDWEGIERGGEPLAFDAELAYELLADPRFSDFREDVTRIARNREHYREENEAQAVKAVKSTAAS